jgi:hypothetical protein
MGVERQTMLEPSAPDPGSLGAFVEPGPMSAFADPARRAIVGDAAGLERELLRRGVGVLTADRHRCADCGRSPLVGERVHLYDRDEIVCELCRPLRRAEPVGSDCVRHAGHGQTVRIRRAA